jgi:hypothetical protein
MSTFFSAKYGSWSLKLGCLLGLLILLQAGGAEPKEVAKSSQIQIARQFLLSLLQKQYKQAYQLMAPEVTAAVTLQQFEAAARPLVEQGQQFGSTIALYKLGMRLTDGPTTRYFYSFSFKSDTLQLKPRVLLDISFRDSISTRILSFGLIPAPQRKVK